jgi:aerobic-type carbon monoxide dehydrogenase small subunit (CoxS/CutS family)
VITIEVNGTSRKINIEPDTPLLWVLRDVIGLTGTKFRGVKSTLDELIGRFGGIE